MYNGPRKADQTEETAPLLRRPVPVMVAAAALAAVTLLAYGLLLARAGAAEGPVLLRACDGGEVELVPEEARMVELHNEARQEAGKEYLCVNPALNEAAGGLAEDMIERAYFDHTDPDGKTMEDRLAQAGYDDYETAGENIAWGVGETTAPEDRFEALMGSEQHKENILNDAYREIGVGYAAGTLKDKEDAGVYATNFGSLRAEAPHERPEAVAEETGGPTGGQTSVIREPIPDATGPESTNPETPDPSDETTIPEEEQERERTQVIQEMTEKTDEQTDEQDNPGGNPPQGDSPDVQAMICETFGGVREDVIGGLQEEGDGPAADIKGRIADDFQDDFLNPGYCDFDPVGKAGDEPGRDGQQ